jgi:hypothetical protein
VNEIAYRVVAQSTGRMPVAPAKNPHAVALGKLGGLRGGKARAEKLSPAKRKAIAKRGAKARWAKRRAMASPPSPPPAP